jgi:mRNA-degrading endonuclease RelE of RelBE toxin-antitoxin system
MSYQLILHSAAENDLSDLPQRLQSDVVFKHLPKIATAPYKSGISKRGKLSKLRGYNFGPKGGYRIVYTILEELRQVMVIAIGPHDQAYRRAERRI